MNFPEKYYEQEDRAMRSITDMKNELEQLREQNAPLHDMYVFFKVETPEGTYRLTMPADKFLEYIDRAIVLTKTARWV